MTQGATTPRYNEIARGTEFGAVARERNRLPQAESENVPDAESGTFRVAVCRGPYGYGFRDRSNSFVCHSVVGSVLCDAAGALTVLK